MNEIWKPVIGKEKYYDVSNLGRVRRKERWTKRIDGKYNHFNQKIIKPATTKIGYVYICMFINRKKAGEFLHRIVAKAFLPHNALKTEVNHKDGNKQNNNVDNLEWVTRQENIRHAYNSGLAHGCKGKNNKRSKPIAALDINTNKIVKTYENAHDAANKLGHKDACSHIASCCRGTRKTCLGFKWKFILN